MLGLAPHVMYLLPKSVVVDRPLELLSAIELLQIVRNSLVINHAVIRKAAEGIGAVSGAVHFQFHPVLPRLMGIHICAKCHVRRS